MGGRALGQVELVVVAGHHDLHDRRQPKAHQEPYPRAAVTAAPRRSHLSARCLSVGIEAPTATNADWAALKIIGR